MLATTHKLISYTVWWFVYRASGFRQARAIIANEHWPNFSLAPHKHISITKHWHSDFTSNSKAQSAFNSKCFSRLLYPSIYLQSEICFHLLWAELESECTELLLHHSLSVTQFEFSWLETTLNLSQLLTSLQLLGFQRLKCRPQRGYFFCYLSYW